MSLSVWLCVACALLWTPAGVGGQTGVATSPSSSSSSSSSTAAAAAANRNPR